MVVALTTMEVAFIIRQMISFLAFENSRKLKKSLGKSCAKLRTNGKVLIPSMVNLSKLILPRALEAK
jgi:hypothetical protein